MTTEVDLRTIPNLPGYGFKRRQKNYHRPQTFNVVNGVRVEHMEGVTFERPKLVKVANPPDPRRHGSTLPMSTTQEEYREAVPRAHAELPAWDALDRHVLRFYGQFKESVVETNLETSRVRNCVVYYYLEDDTAQVLEPKQDNSGLPQGQVIRRHRFPGPSGGYLSWQDLAVGGILHIYGRSIYLVNCDDWSRSYYAAQGIDQGQPESPEQDAFMASREQMQMKDSVGIPRTHERLYREAQLGGGHVNADMQQFMEWDRKVCRFYAVIDDLTLPQHERRPFVIMYFLADDTLEIREMYPLNSGRDPFPIFYGRRRMPRGAARVIGPLDKAPSKEEFVHISDFSVGRVQELMGLRFYVYDADPFTRQYFRDELGETLEGAKDVRLPERAVARPETPPYTGYGSWEDSMGSVHALMPKPPRRDFVKNFANDGKVLRFTAQLRNAKPEDMDRLFVVNYGLADDTLSIHEPPQRNIGLVTGKFLEKGVHVNQLTGAIFKPQDLYPGALIKVYNREFEIVDMDEYTRKYIENPDAGKGFDLDAVLEKFREGLRQQFPLVRDIFRKFDSDHDGVMTVPEFRGALEKWGFQLTDEEVVAIMRHFDSRKDGQVSYNEFCDALLDEDYTTSMLKKRRPLDKAHDAFYAGRAQGKLNERSETDNVRAAVRALGDVVYRQTAAFTKLFKEFAHKTHGQTLTCEQITDALAQIGQSFELEDVRRCVLYVLPDVDPDRVPYVAFLKALVTSYHDLSANR
uniref:Calmodulin n=1 Tax=Alexandrium monilatum TaxID=311494 RepID=A0A7S4RNF6_9DINO